MFRTAKSTINKLFNAILEENGERKENKVLMVDPTILNISRIINTSAILLT